MVRTTALALALAAAALVPTVASAKSGDHHGHGFHSFGGFGITVIDRSYSDSCSWQLVKVGRNLYQKQWVCY